MKTKNVIVWAGQALLALFLAYAGWMKLSQTPVALTEMGWHWAADVPPALITFIGVVEVLGAIGIILPAALRILPWLSTLAAMGMVALQVAAVGLHLFRAETSALWLNAIVLLSAAAVAYALYRRDPLFPQRLAAS